MIELNIFGVLVAILVTTLAVYFSYAIHAFTYWSKRKVKTIPHKFPFGNLTNSFLARHSLSDELTNFYNQTDEPFIGIYSFCKPLLLLRDADLIKQILIKEFSTFTDRGVYNDEKRDPVSGHLFALTGDRWREVRAKLTTCFTSGKLKMMFPKFLESTDRLETYLNKMVDKKETINIRELMARFSTDIIASVAFGVEVDSINNPDTDFRIMGRDFFSPTIRNGLKFFMIFMQPSLAALLKMRIVSKKFEKFLYDLVGENMKYREKNGVVRNDFFQQLLFLRNNGKIGSDDNWSGAFKESKIKNLTLHEMVAHTFVFYLAGFETTSTVMSFALFELAKHQDIQKRVQDEINEVLDRNDGKFTFESVSDMKYLDMCIDETLRMYPSVPLLNRVSNKPFTIPGTDIKLETNTPVIISLYAIMRDKKFFPNPDQFIPERFEKTSDMADKPYFPFGDGPRICIGMRMGKLQAKVGIAALLRNTTFTLDPQTPHTVKFDPRSLTLSPMETPIMHATKNRR